MTNRKAQWALTCALLIAVGSPAWAQTVISFKKLSTGDAGDTNDFTQGGNNISDADLPGFVSVIQDTIVARGHKDSGDPDGPNDVARMNNGARGGDTLGSFGNQTLGALMKFNPNAISTDGSNTPMPAPAEIISAHLRLAWLGEGLGNEASDMIIAALVDDPTNSIAGAYFGDMSEAFNTTGIANGITTENGFNNGVCDNGNTCGPRDQRDFFSNAADTTIINLGSLGISSGNDYPNVATFDHDVTDLFKNGALTGLGVYIGRIGDNQGEGTNLRLSDDSNIPLRPELVLTIPEPASVVLLGLGGLALMPRRRR
ncbi:MAG: hypothetical protein CMJ18_10600 [Phycisphaeraceae bacterium]|nr:hypothetical protein [Phycisphaeraceae bacterium]